MSNRLLSHRARQIENLFDSDKTNSLQAFALQEMSGVIEAKGYAPSHYSLVAVRKNELAGLEVFGPKNLPIGNYSEEVLYGAVSSPLPHFRSAIRTLAAKAAQIAALDEGDVEHSYQITLFWSDVGKLKDFLGVSAHVSELVSEFLTARFQFIGKDTPQSAIAAIAHAFSIATEARRLDSSVVERVVDALESGGLDSLAVDALRSAHA
jgi:hypothetical protein